MTAKDIVSKHLLQKIALDIARLLFGLDVDEAELIDTENQRVEERRADLVLKMRGAEGSSLLHIEIQNDNQREMPWRMLRYRTDIALAHPGLPIRQYLVYIGRAKLNMADGIEEPGLSYNYPLLDMHTVDCERLLSQNTPDALVLAILCDFKGRPERIVVRHILERLQVMLGENEARIRDYFAMLEVLSSNRDLWQVVKEEESMLSQTRYSDLPSYEIGMEQGMEQGMQQGMQQGEAKVLLRQLERKYGATVAAAYRERVESASADTLLEWSDRILTAETIGEIFQ